MKAGGLNEGDLFIFSSIDRGLNKPFREYNTWLAVIPADGKKAK